VECAERIFTRWLASSLFSVIHAGWDMSCASRLFLQQRKVVSQLATSVPLKPIIFVATARRAALEKQTAVKN
jgi:hypothetical protein